LGNLLKRKMGKETAFKTKKTGEKRKKKKRQTAAAKGARAPWPRLIKAKDGRAMP